MSTNWDWVAPIRARFFESPLAGAFPLEATDQRTYWELHEAELRPHFPPEFYFDLQAVLGEDGSRARARLMASESADRLDDFWIARDGQAVAAMFCGHQRDADTYRMWHSHVHPNYRRRGLYTDIIQRMLGYSRELGFAMVVSEHAPGNNAVIIAKLKAGFRIVGMGVDPIGGVEVRLAYFHHEAHLRAFEFRCGLATLNPELIAHAGGAMPLLIEQLAGKTRSKP